MGPLISGKSGLVTFNLARCQGFLSDVKLAKSTAFFPPVTCDPDPKATLPQEQGHIGRVFFDEPVTQRLFRLTSMCLTQATGDHVKIGGSISAMAMEVSEIIPFKFLKIVEGVWYIYTNYITNISYCDISDLTIFSIIYIYARTGYFQKHVRSAYPQCFLMFLFSYPRNLARSESYLYAGIWMKYDVPWRWWRNIPTRMVYI